ncbi:HAMP domain-containing sensor histidine kinase [Mucilaginibacter glaciei]|uniref:histidine kinase n=1 Tax=Mucilaginibacter glaciei TaxID=2772109 RepID=A0A926S0P1_9SPHI|nr:HAMP domain-containing sensor histidine kinase [Mucilaginibacter glaciei]MBD1393175.1 HAMP domain-containing histidine kinase [Mucilaginibacter glaciei]
MKLQTKITLLFVVISTIGLVLLNASIFYFVSEFNFEDFFKRLEARVNLAAEIRINPNKESLAYEQVRTRYLEKLANETEYIMKLDTNRKPVYKKAIDLPDQFYDKILTQRKARYTEQNHFYAGSLFKIKGQKYIVIVAATDPYGFKELEELKKVLLIIFVVSIILTYVAGTIFSYYTVQPVRGIIKRVKNISANNLHMRLDELKSKDEIGELVLTFNNMLTRLETAFETQNNFVSNASHELRTPLTIISGETQLLLKDDRITDEARVSAKTILQEAEKLGHILASLLGLAQTGFDGKKQDWQKIRVDELVIEVAESAKRIDRDSVIDIDFAALPDNAALLYTYGNSNLLQLALSNIVLNACKYSDNRPVTIKLSADAFNITINVVDMGIGIPVDEQQKIFEPFFRASNTGQFKGYGIGLPLTQNIIRLHKGTISISSEVQVGTRMQVTLPVA